MADKMYKKVPVRRTIVTFDAAGLDALNQHLQGNWRLLTDKTRYSEQYVVWELEHRRLTEEVEVFEVEPTEEVNG